MEKLLLIDGHSILNRAYYGVPLFANAEGIHTNAAVSYKHQTLPTTPYL